VEETRLARQCGRETGVAGGPRLDGAAVTAFDLQGCDRRRLGPEAVLDDDFVAGAQGGRRGEKPEAEPVVGRAGLAVAAQVEFRVVKRHQLELAAGHAQRHLLRQSRRQFLEVGFRFRPRDAPVAIGVHGATFSCRPFLEEREVQGKIDVARPDGQLEAVLNAGRQGLMRRRLAQSAERQARDQGPGRITHSPPGARSLDVVVHAMLWPSTPRGRARQGAKRGGGQDTPFPG